MAVLGAKDSGTGSKECLAATVAMGVMEAMEVLGAPAKTEALGAQDSEV